METRGKTSQVDDADKLVGSSNGVVSDGSNEMQPGQESAAVDTSELMATHQALNEGVKAESNKQVSRQRCSQDSSSSPAQSTVEEARRRCFGIEGCPNFKNKR